VSLPAELETALGEPVANARQTSGGSINQAYEVELESGERLFVKTRADVPPGEFTAEAASLDWLGEPDPGVNVPGVRALSDPADNDRGPYFLALESVETGSMSGDGAEELGRGLALMHRAGAEKHGTLPHDSGAGTFNLAGVVMPNEPSDDWPDFYASCRLLPLVKQATDRGSLSARGAEAVHAVCERIHDLAGPDEPPSRLHGDLWSGNVLGAADGSGWLIDPASYGGHREVDLAMLELFGSPSRRLLDAYDETYPLAAGHEDRVALYQLFPLLIHAVLFGGGYGQQVESSASSLIR
jgi:fructosamine-3-kinase